MNNCFVSGLAVLIVMSASAASVARSLINQRVQDPNICWVPDVEFPVPCDEDDD
jgi:hypothetical protein